MKTAALLGLALLTAEATAATLHRPLTAQECRPLETPERLPSIDQLVDSVGLVTGLAAAEALDSNGITLAFSYPRRGRLPTVITLGSEDGGLGNALRSLVQPLLRPGGAKPGTSLRLHFTSPADVRVERSVLCPPVPYDSTALMPVFVASGGAEARPLPQWKSRIQIRVGADGQVLEARLWPGSGRANIDRLVLQPVYLSRWHPATVDGRPVAAWLIDGRASLSAQGRP